MSILSYRSRYAMNPLHEGDDLASELEGAGKRLIKVNIGDPARYFKTPRYVIDAYVKALKDGHTSYSSPYGIPELREAVAERYRRMYNVDANSDDVIVTQGVSEALVFLNASLIDWEDKAVIFRPYYTQYAPDLMLFGGRPIMERYREEIEWGIMTDDLERHVKADISESRKKPKYLIITNPNNPTGTVLPARILREIVDIANNYGMLLVSDEIYDEIVYNGARFTSVSQIADGVPHLILNGASKDFDATGFRLGLALLPGEDKASVELKEQFRRFATIRLSCNTPAEYALAEGLSRHAEHERAVGRMVREIADRANFAAKLINESEYMHAVAPKGAFYIFPKLHMNRLKLRDDRDFAMRLLDEEGVQLTRGSGFGEPGHIRLVVLPEKKVLELAIEKINRFCKRHSK